MRLPQGTAASSAAPSGPGAGGCRPASCAPAAARPPCRCAIHGQPEIGRRSHHDRRTRVPTAVLAPGRPGRPEQAAAHLAGVRTVMPPDSYRLYWIERAKSPAEIQRADEQAARLVSAVSWLSRAIGGPPEP